MPGKRKVFQLSNKEGSAKDTGSKELENGCQQKIKFYNF